ncbi:MAG: hypothetical protein ABI333_14425 [bacterium]
MDNPTRRTAKHSSALEAQVVARRELRYSTSAEASLGRPDHVRAGSSLSWFGGRLAVLQDDASFVALVDPSSGAVESIALPADAAGRRVFDGAEGKANKPDFECSVVARVDGKEVLLALGSGSTARRETVAVLRADDLRAGEAGGARLVPAPALYYSLRACLPFAGSELNLEGAVLVGDKRLWLFQRGNGAQRGDLEPVSSTCELSWSRFWSYLNSAELAPPPEIHAVVNYELGDIEGVPLTFTDATLCPSSSTVLYVASAEDSPDTFRDGEVLGASVGLISEAEVPWTWLLDEHGERLRDKLEGVALHPTLRGRAFICIDPDDSTRPAELCEVELRGPWP